MKLSTSFLDQLVAWPLVIALRVVVLCAFLHRHAKGPLAQQDDLGQTPGFGGQNRSLRICFQNGTLGRELHPLGRD